MRYIILCLALLFWRQAWVSSKSHKCDFTKETYLLSERKEVFCEVVAKPFDDITFICPNKTGALCFHNVNTSESTDKNRMKSSAMPIQDLLYGSVVYGNTLLISPFVKRNTSFYCFCNLDTVTIQKFLKINRFLKDDDELTEADVMKQLKSGEVSRRKYIEYLNKALNRLRKMKDLLIFYNDQEENTTKLKLPDSLNIPHDILNYDVNRSTGSGNSHNRDDVIVEDEVTKKKIISKYGIMRVFVHSNNIAIKGCDFGNNSFSYFSQPFPVQSNVNNKVCKIQAKPGELVGFKCVFEQNGKIEPANCFDQVYYKNAVKDLKTLMPGYVSYRNKHSSKYPYYLKIPHFVKEPYTIQCKCKSNNSQNNDYTFELNIQPGESEVLHNSFKH
ncbi:6-cysteine protein [Plasmodium sp. gorilla clade G3]|nr:6-cysteine protein [Plasmodium sp. gorilla clade G3]